MNRRRIVLNASLDTTRTPIFWRLCIRQNLFQLGVLKWNPSLMQKSNPTISLSKHHALCCFINNSFCSGTYKSLKWGSCSFRLDIQPINLHGTSWIGKHLMAKHLNWSKVCGIIYKMLNLCKNYSSRITCTKIKKYTTSFPKLWKVVCYVVPSKPDRSP
jgi:hypothetical protein